MATIQRSLSARISKQGTAEVLLRLSLSMNIKFRLKSGILVPANRFKDGRIVYPRANQKEAAQLHRIEDELQRLESALIEFCAGRNPQDITKPMLLSAIEQWRNPDQADDASPQSIYELWEEFLSSRDLSKNRADIYRTLARALHRFEAHRQQTADADFALTVETITAETIVQFEHFYRNEWKYYDEFPQIYIDYPAEIRTQHKTHRPQRRGDNICVCMLKKIRTFFNWCNQQGLTDNRPFDRYDGIKAERYGTPYYLTIEERDGIADFDMTDRPQLAKQRDIFVFQCLIGCRVSDLKRLTKSNIIGDWVEYVPQKTSKERGDVVRVPLCDRAKQIIGRYAEEDGDRLLPFISDQRYNDAIKEICRVCGIDRAVTVIDSVTGKDVQRRICDIASSHMARRTFIGNLYKQVKDPSLVGALSGHKEGSKAFARYREIDDDIKRSLIELIK